MKIIRKKRFWGFLAIGLLLPTCCWQSLSVLWNPDAITGLLHQSGPWKPLIFITAHILATAIGVPGTILVIVGGAVFGLWWGTIWSVLGATLGAVAAFWLARYLFHDWFKHRFSHHPRFKGLTQMMHQQGLRCVMTIRFAPISPFNVVNFVLGLTPIGIRPYALGTFIGIIPGTLTYTWLGVTGMKALHGESLIPLLVCLSVLALLSALPVLIQRFQRFHKP
jgi:uncharacterized membrane protein YdjX (TVP38/TMEM64 family)